MIVKIMGTGSCGRANIYYWQVASRTFEAAGPQLSCVSFEIKTPWRLKKTEHCNSNVKRTYGTHSNSFHLSTYELSGWDKLALTKYHKEATNSWTHYH